MYFYNSFQCLGTPVRLGKPTCLSLTHLWLWLMCLRSQERRQRGCGAGTGGLCSDAAARARRFWRASPGGGHSRLLVLPQQGQLSPGKGTWGTADPWADCAQEGASAPPGRARRRQPQASCLCLVFSRPVRQNEKWEQDWPLDLGADSGPVGITGQMKTSDLAAPPHQMEKLSGCEGWQPE